MQYTDVTTQIFSKRVYDKPSTKDGFRVLVDRLWPRGVKKEAAAIDLWYKDIAPSNDLRKWFGHNPAKWDEFKSRYFKELDKNREAVSLLVEKAVRGPLNFVVCRQRQKLQQRGRFYGIYKKLETNEIFEAARRRLCAIRHCKIRR
jgi:uncharacterized protein YeaO (DUF488 family)